VSHWGKEDRSNINGRCNCLYKCKKNVRGLGERWGRNRKENAGIASQKYEQFEEGKTTGGNPKKNIQTKDDGLESNTCFLAENYQGEE